MLPTQFQCLLADLDLYLAAKVNPQLRRFAAVQHKKSYAIYCATEAAVEVERLNISPDQKARLRHEIAERVAALI